MMSLLERIRKQPSAVKTQIAFSAATIMTGCIALVWMTTLPAQLAQTTADVEPEEVQQPVVQEDTEEQNDFFGDISTLFREQFGTLAERIKSIDFSQTESGVANVVRSSSTSTPEAVHSTSSVPDTAPTSTPSTTPPAAPRTVLIGTSTVQSTEE